MRHLSLVVPVLLVALTAGCVTRTVYVVDDRPDASGPVAAAPAPAPRPAPEAAPSRAYEDDAGIASADDFYGPLSPYGSWVSYPGYGMVFVPSTAVVGAGFRPYTNGHWEYTEWGWTWVDHHPFGWATGHYGRWFFDSSYDWVWVPGTTWAPAWVTWRSGGGYVGWAPLPPGAAFGSPYTVYDTSWVFVSYGAMGVTYIGSSIIVGPMYRTCYASTYPERDTVVVYGRTYYRGPDEDDVVRGGGHVIHRPARDADGEHSTTRPPAGTPIRRGSHDRGTVGERGTAHERDGTAPRGSRDDGSRDDRGAPHGRDDGAGHDDRGSPHGRDDATDARGSGRDDGRPDKGARDTRPDALPDAVSSDPRGTDARDGHESPRGTVDPHGLPINPKDDGARGVVVQPQPVVQPITGREDPATGVVDTRPADPRGGVIVPRPIDTRPDVTRPVTSDDPRSPYDDTQRPTKRNPENPDRVRPITQPPTTYTGPSDVDPRTAYPADPRAPSVDPRTAYPADPRAPSYADPRASVDPRAAYPADPRAPSYADPRGPAVGRPAPTRPVTPSVVQPQPQPQPTATTPAKKKPAATKGDGKKGDDKKPAPK